MECSENTLLGLIFLFLMVVLPYFLSQCAKYARMQTPDTAGPHITFEWERQWINSLNAAMPMIPAAQDQSNLSGNHLKCANCLALTDVKCSDCKLAGYCSYECQIIHSRKEHNEVSQPLSRSSAISATTLKPLPSDQANLSSLTHRSNAKKLGMKENASGNQLGSQGKSLGQPKRTKQKDEVSIKMNTMLDVDNRLSLIFYYRIADSWIRQADIYRAEGHIIDLYVMLLRYSKLITEIIPCHKDYSLSPISQKNYFRLKAGDASAEIKTLEPEVRRRLANIIRKSNVRTNQPQHQQDVSSNLFACPPVKKPAPVLQEHVQVTRDNETQEESPRIMDGTMSKIFPQNQVDSTTESGKGSNRTKGPEIVSPNLGSNTGPAIDSMMHLDRNEMKQIQGKFCEKSPSKEAADYEKSSYSSEKSGYLLGKQQHMETVYNLDVQNRHCTCIHPGNNSSLQSQDIKMLEEKIDKWGSELAELIRLQNELLKENEKLRSTNNMAKELEIPHQDKEPTSKNYDAAYLEEFSYLELKEATYNFDENLKIGEGGYGSVYKAVLRCTTVAIKVMNCKGSQGEREFYQEVDVLRKVSHPNIVTFIGGCLQNWALVYEFVPNGSLENYLGTSTGTGTESLSWKTRIHIASNICSALIFLHSVKPHGIAHGDLKPANVLLGSNYCAKLSDFGISRQLKKADDTTTPHHVTDYPRGTLPYIDPEYLQTGEMTPQCDVYAFGIILLQLITGKSANGIYKLVEEALKSKKLNKEIDVSANWPSDKAIKMAKIGLRCCNPTRKKRPGLATEVWSEIESLKQ